MTVKGKFGPISVRDEGGIRKLFLNDQLQGGSFLIPDASEADASLSGPGPVSSSPYSYGWLFAGLINPLGSGVMIGLGSGAGAVQLLYNFPDFDLTVVEIDPVMINEATKNYPLLEYYQDQGKLAIVASDALSYLAEEDWEDWDFGFADAYTGGKKGDLSFLQALCKRCKNIIVNYIGTLADEDMLAVLELMRTVGHPPTDVFKSTYPQFVDDFEGMSNWIITDAELQPAVLQEYKPFPQLDVNKFTWPSARNIEFGRNLWDLMIASSLSQRLAPAGS